MNYTLRDATEQDIPQIVELSGLLADHHHKLDSYWKPGSETKKTFGDMLKNDLEKEDVRWLVAEVDGQIVGYFSGEIKDAKPVISASKIGHISTAFVREEYRGKGIAKAAIETYLVWFRERGVSVAEIGVDSRNIEGVRAWEGLGFKEYMKKLKLDL